MEVAELALLVAAAAAGLRKGPAWRARAAVPASARTSLESFSATRRACARLTGIGSKSSSVSLEASLNDTRRCSSFRFSRCALAYAALPMDSRSSRARAFGGTVGTSWSSLPVPGRSELRASVAVPMQVPRPSAEPASLGTPPPPPISRENSTTCTVSSKRTRQPLPPAPCLVDLSRRLPSPLCVDLRRQPTRPGSKAAVATLLDCCTAAAVLRELEACQEEAFAVEHREGLRSTLPAWLRANRACRINGFRRLEGPLCRASAIVLQHRSRSTERGKAVVL